MTPANFHKYLTNPNISWISGTRKTGHQVAPIPNVAQNLREGCHGLHTVCSITPWHLEILMKMVLCWVWHHQVLGTSSLIADAALYWAKTATGAILPWKWVKAVTQPSTGISAQQAWRECGRSPVSVPLHQFMFQPRFLLTKQTWLLYHSSSFVASDSFSHSFSSLFFPHNSLPFARNPSSPQCCTICMEKKISGLLLAKCDINSFLFSDVQQELALPKRLLVLKQQDY